MLQRTMLLLMLVVGFVGLHAQSLKISDPVKYNDYIVEQQNNIGDELLKLIAMFDALPEDQSIPTDQLNVIISTAKTSIANLNNLKPIANEFGMKQSAIDLFNFYKGTMDTDYRTVLDQLYAETPEVALLQEILVKIQGEEAAVDQKFQEAQEKFSQHHNIQLEENEQQKEFDEINKEN
jgi:hypothetical protein